MFDRSNGPEEVDSTVTFQVFRGRWASWNDSFTEAAEFATGVGRDRLISIAHSEDDDDGVVTVWYWS